MQIFITGLYRTGSSFLSRILNNHPDLWVTYDSVHFMRFCFDKYSPVTKEKNTERLVNEVYERINSRWNMTFSRDAVIAELSAAENIDYAKIYDVLMTHLAAEYKDTAKHWGEKTVLCWSRIPDFLSMFPSGKVIHIVRDPRDTLLSFKKLTTEPVPGYLHTAFSALDSYHSCIVHANICNKKNYCIVRYEDLIDRPEKIVERICGFLDIEFMEVMLDTSKFTDKEGKPWKNNTAYSSSGKNISAGSIGKWKTDASRQEVWLIENVCREYMPIFGYELSGISLESGEWNDLHSQLSTPALNPSYEYWLRTGAGIEGFSTQSLEECGSITAEDRNTLVNSCIL